MNDANGGRPPGSPAEQGDHAADWAEVADVTDFEEENPLEAGPETALCW